MARLAVPYRGGGGIGTLPGPFMGKPWGPLPEQWPGTDGEAHGRNHYVSQADAISTDPTRQMHSGGNKRRRLSRRRRGGGTINSVINSVAYNAQSMYHDIIGDAAPANPAPYMGQFASST